MSRIVWLLVLLDTFYSIMSANWPLKAKSIKDGEMFLGGFFPIHARDNEKICGKLQDEGLIQLEAMLYAVEEINKNSTILPEIKLGVIAVDSCDSIPRALEEAIDFAKGFAIREDSKKNSSYIPPFTCGANVLPHFESGIFERVVAIIGGHSSWVSRQVADLMRMFEVPQVSYQSTSPSLSDIGYEYFFRTVPPLTHQMKAIVEILRHFKWKYFAVVYSDSDYGNKGIEELKKLMLNLNASLCMSSLQRINVENSREKDYDFVMLELLKRNATAVIVFGDHEMARNLMCAATRARASKRFVWIGSTAWVGHSYVITDNEDVLEGSIGINHDLKPFKGFGDYFKSRDLKMHSITNPWFPEYWEKHLNCRVENFTETPFNSIYTEFCPEDAEMPPSCYQHITPTVQFVRDAVYSVAQALHDIYQNECRGSKRCLEYRSMIGEEMRKHLSKVEFEDENRNLFRFDKKGDGPPRYSVVNLQRDDGTNNLHWVPVGSYNGESDSFTLKIDRNLLKYKHDTEDFPESLCSARCREDQAMILLDEAKCCWHCTNCLEYQYVEDGVRCKDCPVYALPNIKRDGCEPIVATYMNFSNSWAAGCIVFSLLGISVTLYVGFVTGKHWDTPIFMISGREFNFILLIGITLSFSLTFAIVAKPSRASCGIVRFFLGLFYTISYASIAAKIRYLSRIFKRHQENKKPKSMNTKSLVLIVLALIGAEGIINIIWLWQSPPATDFKYPSRISKVFICKGSDTADYLVGLVLPSLLMVFCTIYAFRIREFTGAFLEARYIRFTNYTTFIVWLAFIPMFLLNSSNSLRVMLLSVLLNISALVQLVCLFLPKVYIAQRRPEKNKHSNAMCYEARESIHTTV